MGAKPGEPMRWLRMAITQETDSCIDWPFGRSADGYGRVVFEGKTENAHRVALHISGEPMEAGQVARHHCDRPICVNPRHLAWGTQMENVADRTVRGRTSNAYVGTTVCQRGHEYTPENTRIRREGWRECRTCHAENERRRRSRMKESNHL